MDALSAVLARIRVAGSVFSEADLRGRWAVHTAGSRKAIFHVVLEGAMTARRDGDAGSADVVAGDVVVFPAGDGHALVGSPGAAVMELRDLPSEVLPGGLARVTAGTGGAQTRLLCGSFAFDEEAERFLRPVLPRVIVARGASSPELGVVLRWLGSEATRGAPGGAVLVDRLADVLFVQVIRAWLDGDGAGTGWVAALADPPLARAIACMTEAPEVDWTAAQLARRAGMSRTTFYERFTGVVGESPQAWLTRWRMVLARRALRGGRSGVEEIAASVGYQSVAAFTRAFRRSEQTTPARWRQQALAG